MARIHTDLHLIHKDNVPAALKLLIDAGLIKTSFRDVRFNELQGKKRLYDNCSFFEVQEIY